MKLAVDMAVDLDMLNQSVPLLRLLATSFADIVVLLVHKLLQAFTALSVYCRRARTHACIHLAVTVNMAVDLEMNQFVPLLHLLAISFPNIVVLLMRLLLLHQVNYNVGRIHGLQAQQKAQVVS